MITSLFINVTTLAILLASIFGLNLSAELKYARKHYNKLRSALPSFGISVVVTMVVGISACVSEYVAAGTLQQSLLIASCTISSVFAARAAISNVVNQEA